MVFMKMKENNEIFLGYKIIYKTTVFLLFVIFTSFKAKLYFESEDISIAFLLFITWPKDIQ